MALAQVCVPDSLHLAGMCLAPQFGGIRQRGGAVAARRCRHSGPVGPTPATVVLLRDWQIAFVIIIMLTLVFDAIVESGVKALLLDEPFTCVRTPRELAWTRLSAI